MGKVSVKKVLLISIIVLVFAVITAVCVYTFTSHTIYAGVKVGDVSLSNMTTEEAAAAIKNALPDDYKNDSLSLMFDNKEKNINLGDFGVSYDIDQTVESAMRYGKEGNFFARIMNVTKAMFTGHDSGMKFAYDQNALDEQIDNLIDGIGTPVKEFSYEVKDNKLYITNGTPGDMPDKNFVSEKILEAITNLSLNETVVFVKEMREPGKVDIDALEKEFSGEAVDASYEYSGGEVMVHPHKYHIEFNTAEAKKIVSDNPGHGKTYQIPAKVTAPSFLYEDAKARLFSETLGSYKSNYNQGDVSRSSNVALAAKLVNGTVIMPGEEFSYNTVVGKRTAEAGFKVAHVYMNNEVVDGIGGGICQVSSTLYCAVLYANLQVTERVNHQLSVSYVPLGQDATVDYGNIDFRFVNNTGYPLRVLTHASGGTMYASIEGYKDVKETVTIEPVRVGSIPPQIVEEKDDTLPLGERKEGPAGASGTIVETYKTVTVDGKSTRTFVSKSTYAAGKTIVKVGTNEELAKEKAENGDAPVSTETSTTPEGTVPSPVPGATEPVAPAPSEPVPSEPIPPAPPALPDELMSPEQFENLISAE